MKHIKSIDGLRGISIIGVLFFHFDFYIFEKKFLQGGYLGVDIFFLISGFIITRIITLKIKNNNFNLNSFYENRIRRIAPTFLLILTFCLIYIFFFNVILPEVKLNFIKELISSIFFLSNFYYLFLDNYFEHLLTFKPLLHTWSLSVELQFYITIPLLLLLSEANFKKILLIIFTISICIFIIFSFADNKYSFFLYPLRLWEFCIGIYIASIYDKTDFKKNYLFFLGLFLIVVNFFFSKPESWQFFSITSTLAGTAIIILCKSNRKSFRKIIESKFLVHIGFLSYTIYIVHYPFYIFINNSLNLNNFNKFFLIIFIYFVSLTIYHKFEKKFRFKNYLNKSLFYKIIFFWWLFILFISACFFNYSKHNFNNKFIYSPPKKFNDIKNHKFFLSNSFNNKKNIILIGDSMANSIAPTLKDWSLKNNFNFAKSAYNGCQLILDTIRLDNLSKKIKHNCSVELNNKRFDFIKKSDRSIVVIIGRLPLILEETRFNNFEGGYEGEFNDQYQNTKKDLLDKKSRQEFIKDKFIYTINKILDVGHDVLLVYPVPETGFHVPNKIFKILDGNYDLKNKKLIEKPLTTSYQLYKLRTDRAFKVLNLIRDRNGGKVYRFFPDKIMCDNKTNRCFTHDQYQSYYLDHSHLSGYGAKILVKNLQNIFFSFKNK